MSFQLNWKLIVVVQARFGFKNNTQYMRSSEQSLAYSGESIKNKASAIEAESNLLSDHSVWSAVTVPVCPRRMRKRTGLSISSFMVDISHLRLLQYSTLTLNGNCRSLQALALCSRSILVASKVSCWNYFSSRFHPKQDCKLQEIGNSSEQHSGRSLHLFFMDTSKK